MFDFHDKYVGGFGDRLQRQVATPSCRLRRLGRSLPMRLGESPQLQVCEGDPCCLRGGACPRRCPAAWSRTRGKPALTMMPVTCAPLSTTACPWPQDLQLPVAGGGEGEGTGGDRLAGGGEGMVTAVPPAGSRGDGESLQTFCVHVVHPYLSSAVMTGLCVSHGAGVHNLLGSHSPQYGQYILLRVLQTCCGGCSAHS